MFISLEHFHHLVSIFFYFPTLFRFPHLYYFFQSSSPFFPILFSINRTPISYIPFSLQLLRFCALSGRSYEERDLNQYLPGPIFVNFIANSSNIGIAWLCVPAANEYSPLQHHRHNYTIDNDKGQLTLTCTSFIVDNTKSHEYRYTFHAPPDMLYGLVDLYTSALFR